MHYPFSISASGTSPLSYLRFGVTNGQGKATTLLQSLFAGPKTFSVHAGGISVNAGATFVSARPTCGTAAMMGNPPTSAQYYQPTAMAVADFNLDGHLDTMVVNSSSNVILDSYGNGHGYVQRGAGFLVGDLGPSWIARCDLNGDGIPDFMVSDPSNSYINVYSTLTGPSYNLNQRLNVSTNSGLAIICSDIDGDGKNDLVAPVNNANQILFYPGPGDGTFSANIILAAPGSPGYAAVGDVNGDHLNDIVYSGKNRFGVLINQGSDLKDPLIFETSLRA